MITCLSFDLQYTQFEFSVDYSQLQSYNVVCRLISSDEDSGIEECPVLCVKPGCNEIMYVRLEAK